MMTRTKKSIYELPIFVILLAIYPSLALLATNIREVDARSVLRPLFLSLILVGLLAIPLFRIFKDWHKASIFIAILVGLFFTYGHLARLLTQLVGPEFKSSIEILVYLVSVVIIVLAARGIRNLDTNLGQWTTILNISTLALVIFPLAQIVTVTLQLEENASSKAATHAPVNTFRVIFNIYFGTKLPLL